MFASIIPLFLVFVILPFYGFTQEVVSYNNEEWHRKENREQVASGNNSTNADEDYTTVVTITGLKPDTEYYYKVFVNDVDADSIWSFRTLQVERKTGEFAIGFGGCSAYNPEYERIWDTIASQLARRFQGKYT